MNELYFSCLGCKEYIEAAYKWGLSKLVNNGPLQDYSVVDVNAVFETEPFWDVPDTPQHKWIQELLPHIRAFLTKHAGHRISYCDRTKIENEEEYGGLDWIDFSPNPMITPRHLVEILGIRDWQEVHQLVAQKKLKLWWWLDDSYTPHPEWLAYCNMAREVFFQYAQKHSKPNNRMDR